MSASSLSSVVVRLTAQEYSDYCTWLHMPAEIREGMQQIIRLYGRRGNGRPARRVLPSPAKSSLRPRGLAARIARTNRLTPVVLRLAPLALTALGAFSRRGTML